MTFSKRFLLLYFTFFIFLFIPITAHAKDSDEGPSQKIRVAYPIQTGLTEKDADGNYSGYTYEYLQEIAQYTGWEYEFVEVPGDLNEALMTMLTMLQKGEVDIMGGLSKNEQTEAMFDFPEYGYGYSYTSLSISEDNTQINESNLQSVKELRIAAFVNAKVSRANAADFCKLNSIPYTFVDCDSEDSIRNKVLSGEADVVLGNDLSPVEGFRTVAQFSGSQFHFATQKGRSDLLSTLNSTILTIKQSKPLFDSSLHEKYFSNRSYKTFLTDDEKSYIDSVGPLKVVMVTNLEPIQYKNPDGDIAGITKAILDRISTEIGLDMEFISADTFDSAYAMLENGTANAICGIPYDYKVAQKQNLVMSNSLLSSQVVLVTPLNKKKGPAEDTSAVIKGLEIENMDKNVILKTYNNVQDCIAAVSGGQVNYSYMNLYSAEYLAHDSAYSDVALVPQSGKTVNYCLGLSKPADTTLITLLNRGLSNIPPEDMETIIYKSTTGSHDEITLQSLVEQNPFLSLGIVSAIFLVLAIIGISVYRFRVSANKQLYIENQRYLQLSELSNEYIYEYNFSKDILSFSHKFSQLFQLPDKISHAAGLLDEEENTTLNPEILLILKEARSGSEDATSEHLCVLPDSSSRWYRNTRAEIKDSTGKVKYVVGKLSDIQQEKEEKQRLTHQAQIDGLTGIYNSISTKAIINERLSTLTEPAALLIIDIDKFKNVNDLLGHYTGDIVLKDFTRMLTELSSPSDVLGRIGGDEFMLYLHSAPTEKKVAAVCAELCKKARRAYSDDNGTQLTITASIGAVWINTSCEFNTLYKAADKLLYESKKKGRNGYTIEVYNEMD